MTAMNLCPEFSLRFVIRFLQPCAVEHSAQRQIVFRRPQNRKQKPQSRKLEEREMEILLINDVAGRLKTSPATLYRWVSDRRKGIGSFPLPISLPGQTLRWNSEHIDTWCRSQTSPAVNTPAPRSKTSAKERQRREEAVAQAMERHGLGGTKKVGRGRKKR